MTTPGATNTPPNGSQWVQSDPLTFNHNFAGADRAYEAISEVPALTIPYPGLWEVTYSARTNLGVPASATTMYVTTALFNNGALIVGSEAISGKYYTTAESSQNTISQTVLFTFTAGSQVSLRAYRIGQVGTVSILSNADGRTRISAHWVSPGF